MANPVVHFEVLGKDGERLQQFYRDLFGWKIDANNPMKYGYVEPEEGGIRAESLLAREEYRFKLLRSRSKISKQL